MKIKIYKIIAICLLSNFAMQQASDEYENKVMISIKKKKDVASWKIEVKRGVEDAEEFPAEDTTITEIIQSLGHTNKDIFTNFIKALKKPELNWLQKANESKEKIKAFYTKNKTKINIAAGLVAIGALGLSAYSGYKHYDSTLPTRWARAKSFGYGATLGALAVGYNGGKAKLGKAWEGGKTKWGNIQGKLKNLFKD